MKNPNESDPLRDKLRGWGLKGELLEEVHAKILLKATAIGEAARKKAEDVFFRKLSRKDIFDVLNESDAEKTNEEKPKIDQEPPQSSAEGS